MNGLIVIAVFVVSAILTRLLSRGLLGPLILDHPNERSLHSVPVPRTGGLAILAAFGCGVVFLWLQVPGQPQLPWVMAAAGLVALVSFLDDRFGAGIGPRLLVQLAAACLLVYGGLVPHWLQLPGIHWDWPGWLAVPATVLFVVWMTNLYNFMDGMDGFAAGMAVAGFLTFAVLGWQANAAFFAWLNLVLAAAAGGFLLFNFPPATIFMGDVGASTLGFLVAALSLWADGAGIFPLWTGMLVFSPFIVDATVTLLRRLAVRERVWEPHRTHFYQRLVQAGWGHRKTVLVEYLLMGLAGLSAIISPVIPINGRWLLIIMWFFIYLGSGLAVGRLERGREEKEAGSGVQLLKK